MLGMGEQSGTTVTLVIEDAGVRESSQLLWMEPYSFFLKGSNPFTH